MSDDNNSPNTAANTGRPRRGSLTSNTFAAIFGRSNSTSSPPSNNSTQPTPVNPNQSRRLSITTLGLSGTSPIQPSPFGVQAGRRTSISTAGSDSLDESAIEDDEAPGRSVPTTPFSRRVSFGDQALFNARGGSPGSSGRTPSSTSKTPPNTLERKQSTRTQASTQSQPRIPSDLTSSTRSGEGLNWSEQFRSRAESAVSRPSFSTSPSNTMPRPFANSSHERAKSVSDMPEPPSAAMPARPQPSPPAQSALRRKPDAVGERILRGDFYMD